jgi:hypothetical protein
VFLQSLVLRASNVGATRYRFLGDWHACGKLPPIFVRVEKGEWEARLHEGGIIYTQLVVKNMWG